MQDRHTPATKLDAAAHTLVFEPDHVYEVTGIWLKDGQQQALADYFGDLFPIAAESYGVKPLFSLQPISAYAGDFLPHIMFVNQWPSYAAFQSFVNDPRAQALFPRRDAAVSRLVVSHYAVPERREVRLAEGDVIEYGAMWIKPGEEQALAAYYETVFPLAVSHGLSPITGLVSVGSYMGR